MAERSIGSPTPLATFAALIDRARKLAATRRRRLLGITGPPGAGKSTIAAAVATELGRAAIVVPMDGFHLANDELVRLGRDDRKGAPDTFDAEGFVQLVRRLKTPGRAAVTVPAFRRDLEVTIPDAIRVRATTPLVIVEGNYLLLDRPPWSELRGLLHECWYVDGPLDRVERLIARHIAFGKAPSEAVAWVMRSDEENARLIHSTRLLADAIVAPRVTAPNPRSDD